MIENNPLKSINKNLCSYIEKNQHNIKNRPYSAFMGKSDLKLFYKQMLNSINAQKSSQNIYKKRSYTKNQLKYKKIREQTQKIIEWQELPQNKMKTVIKNQNQKQKPINRNRSQTNTNLGLFKQNNESMLDDIRNLKKDQEQKFIKRFYRQKVSIKQNRQLKKPIKSIKNTQKYSNFNIHIKNNDIWKQMLCTVNTQQKPIQLQKDDKKSHQYIKKQIQARFIRKNRYPISNI